MAVAVLHDELTPGGKYSHGAEFAALGVTTDSDAYRIGEDLFMFARLVVTDGVA